MKLTGNMRRHQQVDPNHHTFLTRLCIRVHVHLFAYVSILRVHWTRVRSFIPTRCVEDAEQEVTGNMRGHHQVTPNPEV